MGMGVPGEECWDSTCLQVPRGARGYVLPHHFTLRTLDIPQAPHVHSHPPILEAALWPKIRPKIPLPSPPGRPWLTLGDLK